MAILRSIALAAALLASVLPATAQDMGPIRIELFTGFAETRGVGIAFSGPAGELGAADISFGIDAGAGANWWPLGFQQPFGARLTAGLHAGSAGSYTFSLGSDDASYLRIDGLLVLALPDTHAYTTAAVTVALAPGLHNLELQFYNALCCDSVLTLNPGGLEYVAASPVPEPSAWSLWLAGVAVAGWAARRRVAQAA